VLLQLHPGKTLDRAQVPASFTWSPLGARADDKNVSVVDQHGTLLASQSEARAA